MKPFVQHLSLNALLFLIAALTVFSFCKKKQEQGFMPSNQRLEIPMKLLSLSETVTTDTILGTVIVKETDHGLVFTPSLNLKEAMKKRMSVTGGAMIKEGAHGFHIHANGDCGGATVSGKFVPGSAAGGHWDPNNTKKHGFPWDDDAHMGDLPVLIVNGDSTANQPVLAPRIQSLSQIKGLSLMIHFGGDNHSDHPAMLGGGGARLGCGVIPTESK